MFYTSLLPYLVLTFIPCNYAGKNINAEVRGFRIMNFKLVLLRKLLLIALVKMMLYSHINGQTIDSNLVLVKGGSFKMGAEVNSFFTKRERPQHEVELQSFYMNRTEITNTSYCGFLNAIKNKLKIERKDIADAAGVALRLRGDIICDVKVRDSETFQCGIEIYFDGDKIKGFGVLPQYENYLSHL